MSESMLLRRRQEASTSQSAMPADLSIWTLDSYGMEVDAPTSSPMIVQKALR